MYGTTVDLVDMNQAAVEPFRDAVSEARINEEVPATVEPPRNSRQVLPADTVEFRRHVGVLVGKASLYAISEYMCGRAPLILQPDWLMSGVNVEPLIR